MKKDGLILLNMGGPNNLKEVELFLKNMFDDKNILTMKSDILRKVVGGMIVFNRTEQAQEVYRELGGKSPIVDHTKRLVAKLQSRLGDEVVVDFVMRYTPPFACDVLENLKSYDIDKIYLLPLYPHYSTTTTKSSLEDFELCHHKVGLSSLLIETKHYFENEIYNEAIIDSIKNEMDNEKYEEFDIIFSAHGLPQKIVDAGDVYEKHINRHVEILKDLMLKDGMFFNDVHLAYQSKVGPMKWLEPSLEEKLKNVRNKGILIYPIAFTIDNSETDFELSVEYKEIAQELGFKKYKVCKALNDDEKFVDALIQIYKKMQ